MNHKPISKQLLKRWVKQLPSNFQGRDRTREIVRMRDNHTCQDCGYVWQQGTRRLDIHHLNGLCGMRSKEYDRIDDVGGLITLCHKCHYNHEEFSQKLVNSNDSVYDINFGDFIGVE